MTEEELKLELQCYKEYINPDCDIDNMSLSELKDFYSMYVASEKYQKTLNLGDNKKALYKK
ncbi:MAG: hypothetical protein JXR64_07450 [Spirochaetales bacterium]|nr:hypothetical protein [Spirochaetales bacterium]